MFQNPRPRLAWAGQYSHNCAIVRRNCTDCPPPSSPLLTFRHQAWLVTRHSSAGPLGGPDLSWSDQQWSLLLELSISGLSAITVFFTDYFLPPPLSLSIYQIFGPDWLGWWCVVIFTRISTIFSLFRMNLKSFLAGQILWWKCSIREAEKKYFGKLYYINIFVYHYNLKLISIICWFIFTEITISFIIGVHYYWIRSVLKKTHLNIEIT